MGADDIAKGWTGIREEEPRASASPALAEAIRFDEHRFQSRGRTAVGRGAAGKAATDDHDVGGVFTTKSREIRTTRSRKQVDPGRDSVTCAHAAQKAERRMQILPAPLLHSAFCILHYFGLFLCAAFF